MAKISRNLSIDIRSDFVTRMRSIGKTRKEIEQLNFYLGVSMDNINEAEKLQTTSSVT